MRRKGEGEHLRTARDIGGIGVLFWAVAHAAAARDEEHGDGRDARHEKRVVIGAAHHLCRLVAEIFACLFKASNYAIFRPRGLVGVDESFRDGDRAALGDLRDIAPDGLHH